MEPVVSKLESCFEADTPEREIIVNKTDGTVLCSFTVRQLTIYEIQSSQPPNKSDGNPDIEKLNFNLIKAGVRKFSAPSGAIVETFPLSDDFINSLKKSYLAADGRVITGLFETMGQAVLGINTVSEVEAKN